MLLFENNRLYPKKWFLICGNLLYTPLFHDSLKSHIQNTVARVFNFKMLGTMETIPSQLPLFIWGGGVWVLADEPKKENDLNFTRWSKSYKVLSDPDLFSRETALLPLSFSTQSECGYQYLWSKLAMTAKVDSFCMLMREF